MRKRMLAATLLAALGLGSARAEERPPVLAPAAIPGSGSGAFRETPMNRRSILPVPKKKAGPTLWQRMKAVFVPPKEKTRQDELRARTMEQRRQQMMEARRNGR